MVPVKMGSKMAYCTKGTPPNGAKRSAMWEGVVGYGGSMSLR